MNSSQRILVGEYLIAVAFVSAMAIKGQPSDQSNTGSARFWPWPGTIIRITLSFSAFGLLALFVPEMAAAFAGGLELAAFLKIYSQPGGLAKYTGGVLPENGVYNPLTIGGAS